MCFHKLCENGTFIQMRELYVMCLFHHPSHPLFLCAPLLCHCLPMCVPSLSLSLSCAVLMPAGGSTSCCSWCRQLPGRVWNTASTGRLASERTAIAKLPVQRVRARHGVCHTKIVCVRLCVCACVPCVCVSQHECVDACLCASE